jgi:hypothetical protein
LQKLFLDQSASASAADGFLVQQGNLYVTQVSAPILRVSEGLLQQLVRLIALQYRDELWAQQDLESGARLGQTPGRTRRLSTRRDGEQTVAAYDEKDQVAVDLLRIVRSIPLQVIGK